MMSTEHGQGIILTSALGGQIGVIAMATEFFGGPAAQTFFNSFSDEIIIIEEQPGFPFRHTVRTFQGNFVDYGFSTSAIFIDLESNVQRGGYAEGDRLVDIGDVQGTAFNDVFRGLDLYQFPSPPGSIVNNPGSNRFEGFGGNDILEGRGGADILVGGTGSDTASYETSPAAVSVTVNNPTTGAFSATGGDAQGDVLDSIENLAGSRFNDTLRGSSNANVLAGGRGNDTLDGQAGIDTADYSRD